MDIFSDEFARRCHRARTRLQFPNRLPAVQLPGDVRCSLLESDTTRAVHGAMVEFRDRVVLANCGL